MLDCQIHPVTIQAQKLHFALVARGKYCFVCVSSMVAVEINMLDGGGGGGGCISLNNV